MAKRPSKRPARKATVRGSASAAAAATNGNLVSGIDQLLLEAMARGDESLETGRFVITYKEGGAKDAMASFRSLGLRAADARDFSGQALGDVGDADVVNLPEIGVAIVASTGVKSMGLSVQGEIASDSPLEIVEPEYFVFADQEGAAAEYMRGFLNATTAIAQGLGADIDTIDNESEVDAQVLGATWGLTACKVPQSSRSGAGIRVAVLDTGMDLGHPDFVGRQFVTSTFVGQPVQDLHSHGTHCIGTACGPKAPPGSTPRYGVAFASTIYVGKVLSNSGSGSTGSVLAGMNWAIANRCAVISMSLGSQAPVQAAYTAAGQTALSRGCLIIAAAGNESAGTGAPANSPTIMSVAAVNSSLKHPTFSNTGKVEIAGPGVDVFSSVPRPARYGRKTGTSMATPHVAGCAALLAQTNSSLRGQALWNRLVAMAKPIPGLPPSKVGKGLVQAPA